MSRTAPARTVAYTVAALSAFAANSVLCRLALGDAAVDAASFSAIRVASGAVTLFLISSVVHRQSGPVLNGNWISATLLFLYAVPFSYAYLSLGAGTGALILFGAVQATMILSALGFGERPRPLEWTGLAIALAGLVYLVLPGLSAPSPIGAALMVVAGIAWGVYSLRGRGTTNPLADTAGNFVRAAPLTIVVCGFAVRSLHVSGAGVTLAIASGALASGLGYVIWYAALRGLTATRAATVQLSVPVLAAVGGVMFIAESISIRRYSRMVSLGLLASFLGGALPLSRLARASAAQARNSQTISLPTMPPTSSP